MKHSDITVIIKTAISIIAIGLLVLHMARPDLEIDGVTAILMAIAAVPWIGRVFKAVELPGGWKFEFQDLQRAANQAKEAGLVTQVEGTSSSTRYGFLEVAESDPNLALAGLRIEIEKRLRFMAETHNLDVKQRGLAAMLRQLHDNHIVTGTERAAIRDLMYELNKAVHGATVDSQTKDWVLDVGPQILAGLDGRTKYSVRAHSDRFRFNMAGWGEEKSEAVVMLAARMVDTVPSFSSQDSDTAKEFNENLHWLIWYATKLYSFFCDAEWETRDRDLIAKEGTTGFEKLKERYSRPGPRDAAPGD